jgi:hypothetical protein
MRRALTLVPWEDWNRAVNNAPSRAPAIACNGSD